jgi:hypothetical protein
MDTCFQSRFPFYNCHHLVNRVPSQCTLTAIYRQVYLCVWRPRFLAKDERNLASICPKICSIINANCRKTCTIEVLAHVPVTISIVSTDNCSAYNRFRNDGALGEVETREAYSDFAGLLFY